MERKLRIRLTFSVFVALSLLLSLLFLGTYFVRRAQIDADADGFIDVIMQTGGELPDDTSEYSDSLAEGLYEIRYLYAVVGQDGTLQAINLDHVATIDEEGAEDLLAQVLMRGVERGYVGDYRFRVIYPSNSSFGEPGIIRVALLDRGRQLLTLQEGITSELRIYLGGVLGVTIIFLFMSKRIVRPIVSAHESQRQFVIDAGHDLRTPLSIISADADVLQLEVGESEWIDDIKGQVGVMSDLTESLIVLSRAATEDERRTGVVNLSEAVEREVHGFRSRSLTEGHELVSVVAPRVFVRGNEQYLTRMVGALVDNALKYSAPDGVIEVTLVRKLRQAEVRVTNPTEGIDPREVGRWFERFYQSDQARTHERGGYGIGLSMVAAVARSHGGRARAEAAADGSQVTMVVTLPTVKDPLARDGQARRGDDAP